MYSKKTIGMFILVIYTCLNFIKKTINDLLNISYKFINSLQNKFDPKKKNRTNKKVQNLDTSDYNLKHIIFVILSILSAIISFFIYRNKVSNTDNDDNDDNDRSKSKKKNKKSKKRKGKRKR